MAINRIKTFFTIAYYGLGVIGCRRKGLFLVYSLEENKCPPMEGDGVSARFYLMVRQAHQPVPERSRRVKENLVLMASGGDSHPFSSRGGFLFL